MVPTGKPDCALYNALLTHAYFPCFGNAQNGFPYPASLRTDTEIIRNGAYAASN